jgi:folate-binding protein YgfZ
MSSAHVAYLEHAGAVLLDATPQHFGRVADEYAALTLGCGLIDCSGEARVDAAGADAPGFLHRLLTAGVKHLAPGRGTPAFLLTATGKIILALTVLRVDDIRYKLLGAPGASESLAVEFDRFLFTERVELSDMQALQSLISLQGPQADAVLTRCGLPVPEGELDHAEGHLAGLPVRIARHARFGAAEAGHDLFVPVADFEAAWGALVGAGAHPTGRVACEMRRVEAGRPSFGAEFTAETSPLEVSGLFGITEGKGCYPGQEVIERTLALGSPPRALVRVQGEAALATGAEVHVAGASIGHLTSTTTLPDGRHLGLALVKRRFADTEEPLRAGAVPARRLA